MKNALIGLFLILSLQSFAQSNFRGMSWGASISQLKSKYPDVQWEIENDKGLKIYSTEDYVGGLEALVVYYFNKNKLIAGGYIFTEIHKSNNIYYEDFVEISNILKKKYEMEREEKWNETTWKDDPEHIGNALRHGDVEIIERFENENTSIFHKISGVDYGGIKHGLFYRSVSYLESLKASENEDF